jgi:hypothetical protein
VLPTCIGWATGASPIQFDEEMSMPKGVQRNNKESKKQKKDSSTSKPLSPGAVTPTIVTQVIERGKKKDK